MLKCTKNLFFKLTEATSTVREENVISVFFGTIDASM